ncbi:hypothetical protein HDV62DRAFT_365824 [Trichoderma sp. SZMC 28011]
MATAISVSFFFLQHDVKWDKEKPYHVLFNPPEGLEKSNLNLQQVNNIIVNDVRELDSLPTIEKNGFTLIKIDTGLLTSDEFDDNQTVANIFLQRAAAAVKEALGAHRIQLFDTTVRRRHPEFPVHVGGSYAHLQPTSIAHIDTTEVDAEGIMFKLNPREAAELSKTKYQWFNIWVPLKGPVRDYPLALLDISTIDRHTDLAHQDTVKSDMVHETYQLFSNSNHRWYYVRDQMPDEAWLFIQATSGDNPPPNTIDNISGEL